jgi:cytochrome P450
LGICGIDESHYDVFVDVADIVIECFESTGGGTVAPDLMERADAVLGRCADLILSLADQRRGSAGEDLFTQLVQLHEAEPDRLSRSELATMMMFLVTAGFETTMYTVASAVYHLLRHPDQLNRLRDNPELVGSTVTEVLRYEPGVGCSGMMFAREDVEVGDKVIRRGEAVLVCGHAANHDPAVVPDPLTFDIEKGFTRHMAFGRGRHTCLGATLAREELEIALRRIIARFPGLELVTEQPQWKRSHVLRGITALQVRW